MAKLNMKGTVLECVKALHQQAADETMMLKGLCAQLEAQWHEKRNELDQSNRIFLGLDAMLKDESQ